MVQKLNKINDRLGRSVSWLNLFMVLLTFVIVVFRYVFGLSWVWLQEAVLYAHGAVFMSASGYSLAAGKHVSVDIFFHRWSRKNQLRMKVLGVFIFLIPFVVVMAYYAVPFVQNSWNVLERSGDSNGLPGLFLVKTFVLVYPMTLFLQGLLVVWESWNELKKGRE